MKEIIANSVITVNGLKQYLVYDELQIFTNYEIIFGSEILPKLANVFVTYKESSFYEIKRYYQFVGVIKFISNPRHLSMSIFECSKIDTFLDAFNVLQRNKWSEYQLIKIGKIVEEIESDISKPLLSVRVKE